MSTQTIKAQQKCAMPDGACLWVNSQCCGQNLTSAVSGMLCIMLMASLQNHFRFGIRQIGALHLRLYTTKLPVVHKVFPHCCMYDAVETI